MAFDGNRGGDPARARTKVVSKISRALHDEAAPGADAAAAPLRAARGDSHHPPPAPHTELVGLAFASLRPALLRYLRGLLAAREDAEDVAQETCLKLLTIAEADLRFGTLRALAFKVATNLAYDRFRAQRVRGQASEAELDEMPSEAPPLEHVVGFEQGLALIKRTLLELAPRCRQVFLMRVHVGLDYGEIATQLGVSKRTVEREMAQALEACQRRLRGNDA